MTKLNTLKKFPQYLSRITAVPAWIADMTGDVTQPIYRNILGIGQSEMGAGGGGNRN